MVKSIVDRVVVIGILVTVLGCAGQVQAQQCELNELQELTASDGAAGDSFGQTVALKDDLAIVGAPFDDDAGGKSGSAYIYRNIAGTWVQEAKLVASDASLDDRFGVAVAIGPDWAIVGAVLDNDTDGGTGSIYVFRRTGTSWVEHVKLRASDASISGQFGNSLSLDGDLIAVGANGSRDVFIASGAVHVFRRDDSGTPSDLTDDIWVEEAKLTASDASANDFFGTSVSISGNRIVVGVMFDDERIELGFSLCIFAVGYYLEPRNQTPTL